MPSLGEIFIVSGVAVSTGVDVASGVEVSRIKVGVDVNAGVTVDGRDVATPWQAASKEMESRSGMSFFMSFSAHVGA